MTKTAEATGSTDAIGDDDLTLLALAAEAHDPFGDDIDPLADPDGAASADGLLPEWYMPMPRGRLGTGRRLGLAGLALGMVVINVGGFCVTYGFPEFVWS